MEHVLSMKEQNSSPHQLIQKKPLLAKERVLQGSVAFQ